MFEFEWDDEKARQNLRKHGVSFEQATQAFRDPMGVEWIDDRETYGEERAILLGMAGKRPSHGRSHRPKLWWRPPAHSLNFCTASNPR